MEKRPRIHDARSVLRHHRIVFPGMAGVLCRGLAAHRGRPLAVATVPHHAGAPGFDLSVFDGGLHLNAVANVLSLEEFMTPASQSKLGKRIGTALSILIVAAALVLALVVTRHTNLYPRTDDAEIVANFIGMAPQVEGPILRLHVRDNQFVKQGDLLFEIDDRPYRYALERAMSDQAALEGQIADERRRIAALVSAVSVSEANIQGTEADVTRYAAAVDQARADVASAEPGVSRAQ